MLRISGYKPGQIRTIYERGLRGYENLKKLDSLGIRRLHRKGVHTINERYKRKVNGKTSWYKENKKEKYALDKEEKVDRRGM